MIILTVIMVGYAVAAHSIAYPNGYYTQDNLSIGKCLLLLLLLQFYFPWICVDHVISHVLRLYLCYFLLFFSKRERLLTKISRTPFSLCTPRRTFKCSVTSVWTHSREKVRELSCLFFFQKQLNLMFSDFTSNDSESRVI